MSLVLNTNIASMNAQRNLAATQNQQATTFERLSTGLRVNSAKDDAAGLYLAQAQTKDITGLNMATRNAGDGISLAQTAEGALDQIGQNLQRINELAVQSANGTYSQEARDGLQLEVDELTQEINRIVETTEFNGQKLLNQDAQSYTMQIGFKNEDSSRIDTGLEDGILDGRLTDDGERDYLYLDQAGDLQRATISTDDVANGSTTDEEIVEQFNNDIAAQFGIKVNADEDGFVVGTDLANSFVTAINGAISSAIVLGSDSVAGVPFEATVTRGEGSREVTYTISGTFDQDSSGDIQSFAITGFSVNGEELGSAVYAGSNGIAGALQINSDEDGLAFNDTDSEAGLNFLAIGSGWPEDMQFRESVDLSGGANALVDVLNGDLTSTQTIDISSQESAQIAIQQTREAIDFVSELRAEFGANQNRFEAVISGNQTYSENLSAARSRIEDADFAVETANLAKQQVLQQAGISALGQANASSQAILGLL